APCTGACNPKNHQGPGGSPEFRPVVRLRIRPGPNDPIMSQTRRKDGFTLVEVLIVVVIMGILAAIIVPQFGKPTEDAALAATMAHLSTLRAQIDLYKNQHDGKYPGVAAQNPDLKF